MRPIIFYGDLVTDLVMHIHRLPVQPNQVQNIRSISIEPGGAGNSLIVAARLGARAVALGTIGEDVNGGQIFAMLAGEGVDVSLVQRGAGSVNMTILVLIDDAGEHVFLVHRGHGELFVVDSAVRAAVEGAAAFYLPGYALHEPRVGPLAVEVMRIAASAGVPVISDLGPVVGEEGLRGALLEVLRESRVALLTEDEAVTLSGEKDSGAAARWMLAQGAREVIIKRGAQGCALFRPQAAPIDIAPLRVTAVDTSGAGDAFGAAFTVHWLRCGDTHEAARFANAVGAAKVQKLGTGRNMPTRQEMDAQWARDA